MVRKGLLLDDTGDLMIENGSMVIGASDDQNVASIISANMGEFKEYPVLGVGVVNYLKKQDTNLNGLKREITVNLQADGYKVNSFSIDSTGEFNLDYELNK